MILTSTQRKSFEAITAAFEYEIQYQEQQRALGVKDTIAEELENSLKEFMELWDVKWTQCNHCQVMNQELVNGVCGKCGKHNGKRREIDGDEAWTNREDDAA